MPITPTNIPKNNINPVNKSKGIGAEWADLVASWADSFYGWADSATVTNAVKHSPATGTTTIGSPMGLLLTITYATSTSTGSGWYNVNKN